MTTESHRFLSAYRDRFNLCLHGKPTEFLLIQLRWIGYERFDMQYCNNNAKCPIKTRLKINEKKWPGFIKIFLIVTRLSHFAIIFLMVTYGVNGCWFFVIPPCKNMCMPLDDKTNWNTKITYCFFPNSKLFIFILNFILNLSVFFPSTTWTISYEWK